MKRMTPDHRMMVENNIRIVTYVMKKMRLMIKREDWEDAFQDGAIGLCTAAMLYEPERKIKFSQFAIPCIENSIYKGLRKRNKKIRRMELAALRIDDLFNCDPDDRRFVGGMIADIEDTESAFAYRSLVEFIDHSLSATETRVVHMMLDGQRQIDIAAEIGCSQPQVSRMIKRIERKIGLFRGAYATSMTE